MAGGQKNQGKTSVDIPQLYKTRDKISADKKNCSKKLSDQNSRQIIRDKVFFGEYGGTNNAL